MLISKTRRMLQEDESGQALAVGAMTMLILALSVMVTIQIGNAVHERIAVQNAADSGAFSVSVAVARSLNFISWCNRTIIVHYVAAMAFQSIAAFLTAIEALLGLAAATVNNLGVAVCFLLRLMQACCATIIGAPVCCPIASALAIVQPLIMEAAQGLDALRQAAGAVAQAADYPVAILVTAISALNHYAMFGAEKAMKLMTEGAIAAIAVPNSANFQSKIHDEVCGADKCNKSGTTATAYNAAMGLLNGVVTYNGLFDGDGSEDIPIGGGNTVKLNEPEKETGVGPTDPSGRQPAERLMTHLANATRTGPDAAERHWETDRSLLGRGPLGTFGKFAGIEHHGTAMMVYPMDKNTFAEETVGFSPPQPNFDQCNQAVSGCETKKQACDQAKTQNQQAGQQLTQTQNQCNADCTNPQSAQCTGSSACAALPNKQQAKNDAQSNEDTKCGEANDACNNQGGCNQSTQTPAPALSQSNWALAGSSANKPHKAMWGRGAALATADWVHCGFDAVKWISGGATSKVVGIQAENESKYQFHCKWNGVDQVPTGICPAFHVIKAVKCDDESMHTFWGVSPYVQFQFKDEDDPKPQEEIDRVQFFSLLNMPANKARLPVSLPFGFNDNGNYSYTTNVQTDHTGASTDGNKGGTGELKDMNKIGIASGFGEGLNAYSRSLVYYHRPNAWAEPPNMFNPFWRAKLAPVSRGIEELTNKLGGAGGALPGGIGSYIDEALTH